MRAECRLSPLIRSDSQSVMHLSDPLNAADRFLGQLFRIITVDDASENDLFLFDLILNVLVGDQDRCGNCLFDEFTQLMSVIYGDVW